MTETRAERHRRHLAVMRGWLTGSTYYKAAEALELVCQLEKGKLRKDGETPSFHHQLSVARLVATLGPHLSYAEETITTAFLHDVLEDHFNQVAVNDLDRRFGPLVRSAVRRLTKKGPGWTLDPDFYFEAIGSDPIASVVKLADRVHNLHTMTGAFNKEKQLRYAADFDMWFHPMLKRARRLHPSQFQAYENLKIILTSQVKLVGEMS